MRSTLLCLPWLLAASSCSSPPKPPSVDESRKRPANLAVMVELQACTGDLRNTRILASENARVARASGSTVARLVQQQTLTHAAMAASDADASPQPVSNVHTALFAFGSARLTLADA